MILIKDRHPLFYVRISVRQTVGKYDTYKGSTPYEGWTRSFGR